jgi:chemotaxis protein MotB
MAKSKRKESVGAPAWMSTFADMVTLLMAFFVLLLAFSEMDVVKYKAISGSMKRALGVKAESLEITLPDGTPSNKAEMRGARLPRPDEPVGSPEQQDFKKDVQLVEKHLEEEIRQHKIEVKSWPDRMLLRLPESETFNSGSAAINRNFLPALRKIRATLTQVEGSIAVAGHTDDYPISTSRFPSNWELSSGRASSVVRVLLDQVSADELKKFDFEVPQDIESIAIDPRRVVAQGYAHTRPLVPNDAPENRAKNRRVDIILAKQSTAPKDE